MMYARIAAVVSVVLFLFAGGWYCGSLRSKAALEALEATQAQTVAKAVIAQQESTAAETARLNGIVRDYEAQPILPIATNLVTSLHKYAISCATVPGTPATPASFIRPAPIAGSDGRLERAIDAVIDACGQDASELAAIQKAWPK